MWLQNQIIAGIMVDIFNNLKLNYSSLLNVFQKLMRFLNHKQLLRRPWFHNLTFKAFGFQNFLAFVKKEVFRACLIDSNWIKPTLWMPYLTCIANEVCIRLIWGGSLYITQWRWQLSKYRINEWPRDTSEILFDNAQRKVLRFSLWSDSDWIITETH